MEKNENLVTEEVTENVERTTEQTPRTYTDAEVNEIVGKKIARNTAKINKKHEREYGELIDVLKAGTGKESVSELTDTFKQFYKSKGISIPEKADYTAKDIEILARAEADDIINSGFEDVIEEADRLKDMGVENMTERDKALFKTLTEHIKNTERGNELSQMGVTEDIYNSAEFKAFASKFNANTPITDIYNIYAQTQPKKDIKPMGSMKNSVTTDKSLKDFYTVEEARQFTQKDFDKNPELYKRVVESSYKW